MTDLAKLIADIEGAEEGSRELDGNIWWIIQPVMSGRCFHNASMGLPKALHHDKPMPAGLGRHAVRAMAPHYTTNLQDAVDAVPEGWTYWQVRSRVRRTRFVADLERLADSDDGLESVTAHAKNPSLALCAAILRAKEATQK